MSLQTFASLIIYSDTPSQTYDSSNAADIKSGSITWDASTRTLTFNNVTMEFTAKYHSFQIWGDEDTMIKLVGDNSIVSADYVAIYDYISSNKTLTIMSDDGKGTLYCKGWSGIYVNYTESYLVIKNCTVNTVGISGGGINGDGWNGTSFYGLTIDKANVTAEGTDGGRNYGSISYVLSLTLNDCFIASPTGAHFSTSLHAITTNDLQPSLEKIVIKCRAIDENNFPDEKFRAYVKTNFDGDNDGYLSDAEILAATTIVATSKGIKDLTGIEFFTELTKLECRNSNLSSKPLDLSANTKIEWIDVYGSELTAIDVTKLQNLKHLNVGYNNLTALDLSQNTKLTCLDCYYNTGITSLDLSSLTELDYLHVFGCTLGTLDLSHNTKLTNLQCPKAELTALDVSMLPLLTEISFGQNKFETIDLSHNPELTKVDGTSSPKLQSVKLTGCTKLKTIKLDNCGLTELVLPATCPNLTSLEIYVNKIKGEAMTAFVNSLPTVSAGKMKAVDLNSSNEGNVMTSTQVTKATVKGWTVYYNESNPYDWKVYAGSSPGIAIDDVNFPDDKFRAEIKKKKYDDDQDGYLSDDEIATTTLITVGDMGISNLKGVEFFTALKHLHCYDNELTTLDVSMFPDLRTLSCTRNKLTTLDVTHNPLLDDLGCGGNLLTELDVSQNPELLYLYCQSNQLTALNVTKNTKLKNLYCSGNKLTALDLSKNTELQDLQCYGNELTALDLATCTKLVSLDCSFNKLTALDLSNLAVGIYDIDVYFSNNQIGEEAMQALVESLPTVVTGGLYAIDTSDPAEKNVINSLQVALAKTKNWTVMNYNGSDYEQYEGSVPTGIISIDNGKIIDNDAWYTIDGRRVDNPTKGVYIKNGKKVVIR